ncbi:hypothetical protein PR048_012736 [Dryococelus australis]|uniref:MADF domain-containing protein n=1 Tax=Dryococelus australis TaxID=614101 RepID=A0ABQ9HQU6_9NEOP|nr:hypothetical protein PR048_012736 [Dryococelus australis]
MDFHRPLNIKYSSCVAVIKAASDLHSYVHDRDGFRFEDTLQLSELHDCDGGIQQHLCRGNKATYAYGGKDLQVKWRNIRDSYVINLRVKRTKSGQGRKNMKTYIYANNLEFLNFVFAPLPTESPFYRAENNSRNIDDDDSEDDGDVHPQSVTK